MNNYLKYAGVGFEWIAITFLGFFIGLKFDSWFQLETPWLTMLLAVIFSISSLVVILRRFLKEQNSNKTQKNL